MQLFIVCYQKEANFWNWTTFGGDPNTIIILISQHIHHLFYVKKHFAKYLAINFFPIFNESSNDRENQVR